MPNQFTASLWGDEGFSAILSMKPISEIVKIIIRDTSPPLYNISEHLWFQIFGTSEIAIRSLSFFYYCLAIFFVYKIGEYLYGRNTGLLAAALSFFNPFFFIYAFEGRMYSILALGVIASNYFFIKILFSKFTRKTPFPFLNIICYALATAWALYSHHFGIFMIFIQGLWFLFTLLKREFKKSLFIFLGLAIAALFYTPWLTPLYNQTKMVGSGFWLGTPTVKDLGKLILEYLAAGIKHNLATWAVVVCLVAFILRTWNTKKLSTIFLLTWFLGPILLTWTVSQFFQSIFYNRYLLYAIPGAMLLVASNRRKYLSVIILGILLGLFVRIDHYYFFHPTKRPFREFAAYVKEVKRGDDYLINWNAGSHHLWETKYYQIPSPIYIPNKGELPFFVGTALMTKEDIVSSIPKKINRVGVITSGNVDEINVSGYPKKGEPVIYGDLKFLWLEK